MAFPSLFQTDALTYFPEGLDRTSETGLLGGKSDKMI